MARAAPPPTGSTAIDLTLSPKEMLRLFDLLPDVLFFIKDTQCRYTHVNQTLTQRLGIRRREDILGKPFGMYDYAPVGLGLAALCVGQL